MFSRLSVFILGASALLGAFAAPVTGALDTRNQCSPKFCSLNNWGGHASMSGFDNFCGPHNFNCSFKSAEIKVVQEQSVVCRAQKVEIIQQRLIILQEMAKKIITELICEVETQTIVFAQFQSHMSNFGHEIDRTSGHPPAYNKHIASQYNKLFNSDGSFTDFDLGFSGKDLPNGLVIPSGSNWDDQVSPSRVKEASGAANNAAIFQRSA